MGWGGEGRGGEGRGWERKGREGKGREFSKDSLALFLALGEDCKQKEQRE
jgi:hypothetical protein